MLGGFKWGQGVKNGVGGLKSSSMGIEIALGAQKLC